MCLMLWKREEGVRREGGRKGGWDEERGREEVLRVNTSGGNPNS